MYTKLLLIAHLFSSYGNLPHLIVVGSDLKQMKPSMIVTSSPKNQQTTSKRSLQDMLLALGFRETRIQSGAKQYMFENPELGFLGKYQFAEVLLIRLGYYQAKVYYGNGSNKNYWRGRWTGKNGIDSKVKFLNSPEVQEKAIREAFAVYWQDINNILKTQGKSINEYLDRKKTFDDKGKPKTITITISGILAGAHLRGPDKVVQLLTSGKVSYDEFGTSILEYVEEFGGYETTLKDFSSL
jgi:hypothetical protein